jgi:hypothetical protein
MIEMVEIRKWGIVRTHQSYPAHLSRIRPGAHDAAEDRPTRKEEERSIDAPATRHGNLSMNACR